MLNVFPEILVVASFWVPVQAHELLNPELHDYRRAPSVDFYKKHDVKPASEACHVRSPSGEVSFSLRCQEGK